MRMGTAFIATSRERACNRTVRWTWPSSVAASVASSACTTRARPGSTPCCWKSRMPWAGCGAGCRRGRTSRSARSTGHWATCRWRARRNPPSSPTSKPGSIASGWPATSGLARRCCGPIMPTVPGSSTRPVAWCAPVTWSPPAARTTRRGSRPWTGAAPRCANCTRASCATPPVSPARTCWWSAAARRPSTCSTCASSTARAAWPGPTGA
jgi:hypothetical protein